MDPLGFALEHFDPIGQRQELDNGEAVDASGSLDGASFYGASELGALIAEHTAFADCMTLQMYRHGNGQSELERELPAIQALTDDFIADDMRLVDLVEGLVLSESFRFASAPVRYDCLTSQEGNTRACFTACGEGIEVCQREAWSPCSALRPGTESCNNLDDDCDGRIDAREQACETEEGLGLSECRDGVWSTCEGPPPPPEICNGEDDDLDGQIDEDLEVSIVNLPDTMLVEADRGCDPIEGPGSAACDMAAHDVCAEMSCYESGLGPLVAGVAPGRAEVVCLDADHAVTVETNYTELANYHSNCTEENEYRPDCFAAINRLCNDMGMRTGVGPIDDAAGTLRVVCTPRATIIETTYTVLSSLNGSCDGTNARFGIYCDAAFHQLCRGRGYSSGYGPLENWYDTALVACIGEGDEG